MDICVRNEAEETCLQLVSLLDSHGFNLDNAIPSLGPVKGISYRQEDKIRENPAADILIHHRKQPGYLDKYPSPYTSGVLETADLGIITARGCTRHCTYCNCAVISKRIIAAHSVDRVLEELDFIARRLVSDQVRKVDVFDDAFTLWPERALEICNRMIENKISLPLSCITRCDTVSEELLDRMKEAGFAGVGFALESASPRVLRTIGKVQPPWTKADPGFRKEEEFVNQLSKYVKYAKKAGFRIVHTSIMIGLPGETLEEGQKTVDLVRSIESSIDFYSHNLFQVYPGAPVFDDHQRYGLKLHAHDNGIHYKTIYPYDIRQIPSAPRSNLVSDANGQDRTNLKHLALTLTGKSGPDFVNKVIFTGSLISEELILWLQNYLAINGKFIQVFPDLESARKYYPVNENAKYLHISPTNSHSVYYESKKGNGQTTFIPYRFHILGPGIGMPLHMVETEYALSEEAGDLDSLCTICVENPKNKKDALELVALLAELEKQNAGFNALLDSPVYPYFSALCRWQKEPANCRALETVFIDEKYNIKTCWNGGSIGSISMSLPQIKEKLAEIHRMVMEERDCATCSAARRCTVCLFPAPLESNEYCRIKKKNALEKSADLLRAFDVFKEIQF